MSRVKCWKNAGPCRWLMLGLFFAKCVLRSVFFLCLTSWCCVVHRVCVTVMLICEDGNRFSFPLEHLFFRSLYLHACSARTKLLTIESPPQVPVFRLRHSTYLPGADHILAQPHASHASPNETFEFAKKRQKILCFGMCGRENFFTLLPSCAQSPKTVKNLFVLQFWSWNGSFRHGEMKIWLCLYFSMSWGILELILWKKADKKCKDQKGAFFCEGCFDRKECVSNTANKRCSRQVLQLWCSWWYSIKIYT